MYLWRKRAGPAWWAAHESELRDRFGEAVAVIEQPNRKTLEIQITCDSANDLKHFGGRATKLPRDWLKRFARSQKTKPIRIAGRELVIPAGAAFGTGEHATTSMCLTLLKECFSGKKLDWFNQSSLSRATLQDVRTTHTVVDLGTGSGILALAARSLGAKRVLAIDDDPIAIRTARQNATRNRIRGIEFRIADARKLRGRADVLTANLFSELVIEALPNWRGSRRLILSGILRTQQSDVRRALRANGFRVVTIRRRGKWIAMLAATRR
jgi:ribosomal protein L11 methyltransferase